ncbi:MAG: hypothetical protein MHM6MM_006257 [Cercozoa sp. M6MM]
MYTAASASRSALRVRTAAMHGDGVPQPKLEQVVEQPGLYDKNMHGRQPPVEASLKQLP